NIGNHERPNNISLSFIAKLTNLQELEFSFYYIHSFEDFKKLQYITFSKLQSLKFLYECPRNELLIQFLENNGRNLKDFYFRYCNDELNLALIEFCPNIRKLFTGYV